VTAHLLTSSRAALTTIVRLAIGCAAQVYVVGARGPAAAHVWRDRLTLIEAARPKLAGAKRVATVDVGWVGAATGAEIIDLAGATDPDIAALPGGHTSKIVSGAFLTGRAPDRLVFQIASQTEGDAIVPARLVEWRLFVDPLVARAYRTTWQSPTSLPVRYIIMSPAAASLGEP
jgi:hypothetical protein